MRVVHAVIVTYNRLAWFQDCLESVQRQTYPIEHLYIINNGSTDGTTEWLNSHTFSLPTTVKHQENVGGAGGFHTGMKAAYEAGAEWIWIMDDDVEVDPDCLEVLLRHTDQSRCLNPHKFYNDGKEYLWEAIFSPDSGLFTPLNNASFANGKDVCFVNIACFEGMLVHRDVVARIGYPDPRFFLLHDDMLYGLLASLHTNVAYVRDARIRTKKSSAPAPPSPAFLYYYIRNMHLVYEALDKYFPGSKRRMRRFLHSYFTAKLWLGALRTLDWAKLRIVGGAYRAYRRREVGRGAFPRLIAGRRGRSS